MPKKRCGTAGIESTFDAVLRGDSDRGEWAQFRDDVNQIIRCHAVSEF